MGKITYNITGDAAKLESELKKSGAEIDKLKNKLRDTGRAGQGVNRVGETMGRTFRELASALGIGFGIAGAVQAARGALRLMREDADKMTAAVKESSLSLIAFAQMQEKGQVGVRARESAALGAAYGVKPGEAWSTVQALQAKTGSYEQGVAAARAAFQLQQLAGVPSEGARTAVSVGMGLGLTPEQAARAAYAAGKASELTPAQLAEMGGQGLPAYQGIGGGPITGYGVAAGLSGLIRDPGELGTYTRQVGILLQRTTGKVGDTWRRLGFDKPGEKPMGQLQALADAGITTMGKLEEAGFSQKQSQGLAILLGQWERARPVIERVSELYKDEGSIRRERISAEGELPTMRYTRLIEEQEASIKAMESLGAEPERATLRELGGLYLQRQLREQGAGPISRWFHGRAYGMQTRMLGMDPAQAVGTALVAAGDQPRESRGWGPGRGYDPAIQREAQTFSEYIAGQGAEGQTSKELLDKLDSIHDELKTGNQLRQTGPSFSGAVEGTL